MIWTRWRVRWPPLCLLWALLAAWSPQAFAAEPPLPQDQMKQWQASAEKGDAAAQHQLGLVYEKGKGVETNTIEAAKWYRKAAEQGLAAAQFKLGLAYLKG